MKKEKRVWKKIFLCPDWTLNRCESKGFRIIMICLNLSCLVNNFPTVSDKRLHSDTPSVPATTVSTQNY